MEGKKLSDLDLLVRRARPEDYEGVLSIDRGLYNDIDYLPSRYHDYLKNPRRFITVITSADEIVSWNTRFWLSTQL